MSIQMVLNLFVGCLPDSKKGGHTATPHPAKKTGKTPAAKLESPKSGGQFSCKSCDRYCLVIIYHLPENGRFRTLLTICSPLYQGIRF